ncbi:YceI family protein [Geofilum sp. OHC36d9]|uniref:YceI family protein n=1 Tax=Geofilum sp. OHC36d9 TaxID=3458413 RepID=UPI0040348A70
MKRISLILSIILLSAVTTTFAQATAKLKSTKTHIRFFSTTPAENIEANNFASVSTLSTATGESIFSVPMQSFEFEKALMQKHFNSGKFLDTKAFPTAKLKGKITNITEIDFSKDGIYQAKVTGDLTIKGKTNPINESATITVKGNTVSVSGKFNITLADYGITFVGGKPASNIARTVEVTVHSEYQQ